ncbi:hypothetical protein AAG906_000380 [Vitis piasezkii]
MLTTSTSPTMPSNNCDTPWYMDSRATHHFTPEFGNLTDSCVFTGDEIKPRGRYFFKEYLKMDSTKFHHQLVLRHPLLSHIHQLHIQFLLLNYPSIVLKPSSLSIIILYCGIID